MVAPSTIAKPRPRTPEGGAFARRVGRRYELRPSGMLFIAITLFIAIGAVNSQNNLLFWLFGMAVGAILVSGVASGAALMGLQARRIPPKMIEAESRGVIAYELRHRGRFFPAFALLIQERAATAPPGARAGRLEPAPALVEHLSPGSSARGRAWADAKSRGLVQLDRFEVSTTFPFGLFRKSIIFEQTQVIAITPVSIPVRERLLQTLELGSEHGSPRAGRPGFSDEFYALRSYVPGDSPRTIAWRRSAALGELVVRQFSAPMPPRLVLTLRQDIARADERTRERAIALLASLARAGGAAGYSIGIDIAWAGYRSPLGGGARLVQRWLMELAALDLEQDRSRTDPPPLSRAAGRLVLFAAASGDPEPAGPALDVSDEASWLAPGVTLPDSLRDPANPRRAEPVEHAARVDARSWKIGRSA